VDYEDGSFTDAQTSVSASVQKQAKPTANTLTVRGDSQERRNRCRGCNGGSLRHRIGGL
jgi:hypothetical protein